MNRAPVYDATTAKQLQGHIVRDLVRCNFGEVIEVRGMTVTLVGLVSRRCWDADANEVEIIPPGQEIRARNAAKNVRSSPQCL